LAQEELQKYHVFICYYTRTGISYAEHLKHGLHDMDISAFVASEDIPKTIKKNTEKWRNIIDYALKNSDKFILIMTLGFNNRLEIKREFKLARKLKDIIYCKHKNVPKDELKIQINEDCIDLSEYEYIEFEDKPDLLSQVGLLLKYGIKSTVKREGDIFLNHAYEIIKNEGKRLKQTSEPQLEIVIGSDNLHNIWLERNDDVNKSKLRGHFFKPYQVTARRYFFEFSTIRENEYLKIYTNGFYHTIIPIYCETNGCSLEAIVYDILCHLIYFIILLNSNKVTNNQFFYIIFRNISSKLFTLEYRWRKKYSFPKDYYDVNFLFNFTPNLKWVNYKNVFIYMFKEIFQELGIDDVNDIFIEEIIKNLISTIAHDVSGFDIKEFEFI